MVLTASFRLFFANHIISELTDPQRPAAEHRRVHVERHRSAVEHHPNRLTEIPRRPPARSVTTRDSDDVTGPADPSTFRQIAGEVVARGDRKLNKPDLCPRDRRP